MNSAHNSTLLLIPTRMELETLEQHAGSCLGDPYWQSVEVIGFGPVAAAATTAALIARYFPTRIVLAGIAGTYGDATEVGTATTFGSVSIDGVGAGDREGFGLPSVIGFPQMERTDAPAIFESLQLASRGGELLTVCAASEGTDMLTARLARFPDAVAEDMEAFGVALAASTAGVEVEVIRGFSNLAGDRDVRGWKTSEALASVARLLGARAGRDDQERTGQT